MGKVIIQEFTTKNPISLIGQEAGICYGSDVNNQEKNYKRGLDCLESNHGRTFEFPDIYMILDGYSARVIREWYTHIGGSPTRLQASTRYIKYQKGFNYITPKTINKNEEALKIYDETMKKILNSLKQLEEIGIPKEDSANLLPLGMETKIVCKHNFRNILDMAKNRKCVRAYWEYRQLFKDLEDALRNYSEEWAYLVDNYFETKCDTLQYCPEKFGCGKYPKANN